MSDTSTTIGIMAGVIIFVCCFCCWWRRRPRGPSITIPRATNTSSSSSSASDRLLVTQSGLEIGANRINLVLVVDASGSMQGARWDSAVAGVRAAVAELTSHDVVTVITFNTDVKVIGPAPKAAINLQPFFSTYPMAGTALYDAILAALHVSLPLHLAVDASEARMQALTYIVVMTDGEDTHSRSSIDAVCEALRRINTLRNFKVLLAGVDLPPAGRNAMHRLASVGDGDIRYMDVKDGFGDVFQHIHLALTRRTHVINVH